MVSPPELAAHLIETAHRFGTPAYVTDVATLARAAREVAEAFPDPWLRQYSLKANDVPAIVARIAALGFGANVVSGGEWSLARRAGLPNGRITLEGVGKSDTDLQSAVRAAGNGQPLRWLAIESAEEATVLGRLAGEAGLGRNGAPRLDVLLRLNPDVTPETIAALAVGAGSSKFGLRAAELGSAILAAGGPHGPLRWQGLQLHIGSQLQALEAWRRAVGQALAVFSAWRRSLPDFEVLDIGGGFPVAPGDQPIPAPADFAGAVRTALDGLASGRSATHPRARTRSFPGGSGGMDRRPGVASPGRARSRRGATGHHRRRHDGADPAGSLRGPSRNQCVDVRRAPDRAGRRLRDAADPGRRTHLRIDRSPGSVPAAPAPAR
jgi:diaminopimelate decarboxylase